MTKTQIFATSAALVTTLAVAMLVLEKDDPQQSDVTPRSGVVPAGANVVSVAPAESSRVGPTTAERSAQPRDWLRSFADSADDFALAQELAAAALDGDARAQYVLGRLLLECEILRRGLAQYQQGTLAERVESHLATLQHGPERTRQTFRRQASRCERLVSGDQPFAGHELPDEAKSFRYWSSRALESRDPLAVMDHAVRSVADRGSRVAGAKDPAFKESLLSDVRAVVFSGDAAAVFTVGGVFAHPAVVGDPAHGYAWQIAACEIGYDCSKANPAIGFGCAEDGTCVAGETLLDAMQRDFGAARYAAIYANAQDIQYKIRTHDWDGLQQYLQVQQ